MALGAVVWGSLTPNPPTVDVSNADKVQHFAAYAGLAVLAFLALRRASLRAAAALILFGVGVEVAQAATALGRQGSWLDAVANSAGVLLVWLVGSRFGRRRPAKL